MNKTLEIIERYVLWGTLFLLPLAMAPFFANQYATAKIIVLVVGVIILLLIKALKIISTGKISISIGSFDFPVILLGASYLASGILNTPNKLEAFFLPGTATVVVAGTLLYLIINQETNEEKKALPQLLFISAVVASIFSLLSAANVFSSITALPAFMRVDGFSPLGGTLPALMFFIAMIPLGIRAIISETDMPKRVFWGVSLALVVFGAVISGFNALPGKTTSVVLPSLNTSWTITIDSLKVSPLLGMGPGNYLTAFNNFRPLEYNSTDLWQIRFTAARNFFLTAITETGLLGLAALILLIYSASRIYKSSSKDWKLMDFGKSDSATIASLTVVAILLVLFPSNIVITPLLFVLLALNASVHSLNLGAISTTNRSDEVREQFASRLPVLVVTLPLVIALFALIYFGAKITYAEYVYKQALDAVAANDGRKAYDLFQKAITTSPYSDRYHTSYAQLNLALANAIAANENITDEDRATIAQLIQQAIREGKSTVALNPTRAGNWEVLARIYQAVIPLADNADAFAAETFRQAVALDPINPDLRIALGGIYYGAGDYANAIRIFELAVASKADLANAHFNLAYAYQQNGQIDAAIQQMSIVLSLVERDSQDYEIASKALEEMESLRDQAQAETPEGEGENLEAPEEPEQVLNPRINLPEDAEPPAPSVSPTPISESEGSASPTPLP